MNFIMTVAVSLFALRMKLQQ